ncbi:hypothetical protein IFM89_027008, partial [Coptis chinensis]
RQVAKYIKSHSKSNMELIFLSIPILLLALFISLVTLLSHRTKNKSQTCINALKFPPGKMGWPILGESLEYLNMGRRGVPEKFFNDRMRKFSAKIFKTSILGESMAVFCGPEGLKFLFSNENKLVTVWFPSSVNKIFPFSLQSSGNEECKKMRKMLPGFLRPEALQRYIGTMDSIAKQHLKTHWDDKNEVLVFPLAKSYTISLACKLFVSVEDVVQIAKFADPFACLASGIVSIPIDFPGTSLNKAVKAANLIRKDLHEIIKQRKVDLDQNKASPTQDILSHMLLTTDENGQSMEEMDVADKILGLIIGGHDTASTAITFVVKYLSKLPHIYNEVLKEQMEIKTSKREGELLNWEDIKKMRYSWNVVCEVMRLTPPSPGAFREAITDFAYEGFSIPKGWKLFWSTNSTHKNAKYFPDPEKFDPSRFEGNGPAPYTYVPFGGGPRMCPGQEYARLEILVFMHNVVTKFKWEEVLRDEKIIVDPLPAPAKGLPVRLQPHIENLFVFVQGVDSAWLGLRQCNTKHLFHVHTFWRDTIFKCPFKRLNQDTQYKVKRTLHQRQARTHPSPGSKREELKMVSLIVNTGVYEPLCFERQGTLPGNWVPSYPPRRSQESECPSVLYNP